jgi:hypothetical protein
MSHAAEQRPNNRPTGAGDTCNAAPAQRLHRPRGRGTKRRAATSEPECGPPRDPRHPRGDDVARLARPPYAGDPAGLVPRHPRGADGVAGSAPSAETLRPLARALVALALEVRAEGLALGEPWRSDGPTDKGGGRCAV